MVGKEYFEALSRIPLLDAEGERAVAEELREAKRALWQAILAEPLTGRAVMSDLEALPGAESVERELAQVRRARKRSTGFIRTVSRLSEALVDMAPDFVIAERASMKAEAAGVGAPDPEGFVRILNRARRRTILLRQKLASANLRLVVSLARAYASPVPLADRIQDGNAALMIAVDRFDPRRGHRFATYASWWIRHGILRAIQERGRLIRLPVNVSAARLEIDRTRRRLTEELGHPPSAEELADSLHMRRERLETIERYLAQRPIALGEPSSDEDRPLSERLADPQAEAAMMAVETSRDVLRVREAIRSLPSMDREVLCKAFGIAGESQRSCAAIGREYELSRERIRQIRERALRRVRRELERAERQAA